MVTEIHAQSRQVNFDPLQEPGKVRPLEVVIHQKRHLAGLKVRLDQVDRTRIAEELQGAPNIDPNQRKALSEDRLMESQVVVLVQNPDAELVVAEDGSFLQSGTVPRREQGPLPRIPRLGDAAEEELHVPLEPVGELAVRPSPAEVA